MMQRASPKAVDRLSAWCQQWLGGGEGEALGRAAAQAAALQAQAEGALFARRVSGLLPALLTVLGADGQVRGLRQGMSSGQLQKDARFGMILEGDHCLGSSSCPIMGTCVCTV